VRRRLFALPLPFEQALTLAPRRARSQITCYKCGAPGHFANRYAVPLSQYRPASWASEVARRAVLSSPLFAPTAALASRILS